MLDQIIRTKRLALRPFRPSDAPRIVELAGAWDVARMTGRIPHPYPPQAADEWIAARKEKEASGADYSFAIALEDRCIGCVGLYQQGCHKLEPGDTTGIEIGYWLGMPYWGRGFATEAVRAGLEFAYGPLAKTLVVAGYFADNPASGRILEKLGFAIVGHGKRECLARGGDVDAVLVSLTREAWTANQSQDPAAHG